MAQYEMNLRDYWQIIRRRRFIIVVSTVLVALLSFWFARQKVPVYEATAAVKFEQSASLSGLLVEVLSYSSADSIETQASLIKSYPILEEVARRLGRLPQTARGEPLRESRAYMAALDAIAAKIRTSRVPSTSIMEITATSTNPREARELANTMAEAYRSYNRAIRNARITEARKFIEAQLGEVEGRVKRAEEEVWAFREANRIIAPGAESSVLLSLFTQIRGDIEKTRQQRTELDQALIRLSRTDPVSLRERVFVDSDNPALQKLLATHVELMLERNNLALEVTDRHPRLQALGDRLREVRAEMRREVASQIALLRNREEILNRQMGELLQRNREIPSVELAMQRLQRDVKVNDDLLTLLKTKHQEALIKEAEGVEEVTLVRPATEPVAPAGAEAFNTVLVGALLGLMLGLVLAFVQETLDTSIGTIEDVESYLQVPVLGIVPHINAAETIQRLIERRPALADTEPEALQAHALLITHFDPKSPVAEAYRTLRTHVQFEMRERSGKVLVVTSPTLQEGKTTTIVNLALTMAQNGLRTLLVGANLRRPSIHRFFGIEREPGLSDILVGNAQWRECTRTVADMLMGRFEMEDIMASPGLDNLHIIESGPIPANPSELLSTPAMSQFLAQVRAEYDIVLIDTPPVLPVTDSAIVAAQADGVVIVYQAGKVGRLVLKRAKAHLESARAKVWGVVLNDVQSEVTGYAYTHYYTHYYGEETPGDGGAGRLARLWEAVRSRLSGGEETADAGLGRAGDAGVRRVERLWDAVRSRLGGGEATPAPGGAGRRGGLWEAVRSRLRGGPAGGSAPSALEAQPPGTAPGDPAAPPERQPGSGGPLDYGAATPAPGGGGRLRRLWKAVRSRLRGRFFVLLLLPAALAGLLTWPLGSLTEPPRPREALRKRLEPEAPVPTTPDLPRAVMVPPSALNPMGPAEGAMPAPPPPAALPESPAPPAPPPASAGPEVRPAPAPPSPTGVPPVRPTPVPPPPSAVPELRPTPVPPRRTALPEVRPAPASTPTSPPPLVLNPLEAPSPQRPAGPASAPSQPSGSETPPRVAATPSPSPAPPRSPTTVPEAAPLTRFAVEFGPFATPAEAERVERQLNQAGHQTVRFRQQTGAAVYGVFVERLPGAREAEALMATLQAEGLGEGTLVVDGQALRVRVGEPVALRGAVQLAERLRARGHAVRIAAQPGEAVTFIVRHGNFASREEADVTGEALARLGLANHVIRVR